MNTEAVPRCRFINTALAVGSGADPRASPAPVRSPGSARAPRGPHPPAVASWRLTGTKLRRFVGRAASPRHHMTTLPALTRTAAARLSVFGANLGVLVLQDVHFCIVCVQRERPEST
ncbi:hypothetical protein AAFF_G00275030 [Aldrovandia affinis]|uniref:Uncharacterized protein n=1 Tax=Aldrovandia affinis TaxID=143900 RepID=A0AAD7STS8_9TELE|nr:hypothetical protein AAFF_G00275030 [Aldrovandia affinis]